MDLSRYRQQISQSGLVLFLRELLRNPRAIGAAIPSSRWLARAIAKQIPMLRDDEAIVELGPGTGVVTKALLEHCCQASPLILIERSAKLSKHLEKHFPQSTVLHGDARHLQQLLADKASSVQAIISSLPLRSIPAADVATICQQALRILNTNGLFIQFTYVWWGQDKQLSKHFERIRSQHVWCNFPPARIDVYRKAGGPS